RGATLTDVRADLATFSGADFRGAKLARVSAFKAVFEKDIFQRVDLREPAFPSADLRGADFRDAVLDSVVLRKADLRGAVLPRRLTKVVFNEAILSQRDLQGAD